jgi:valyl-tRNA synthetase
VDRFGADATRFTLARGANPGGDIAISEEWAAGSRNFCNKLWNAVRFALLNGAHVPATAPDPAQAPSPTGPADPRKSDISYSVPDRWILSRLSAVIAETDRLFEAFEFGKVCDVLYHFAWDEVCDWYLELAKVPLTSADEASRGGQGGSSPRASTAAEATRQVLGFVLDQLLRLLHPVMPFVTEELWTALTGEESVMVATWPAFAFADRAAEAEISSMMRLVTEIRRFRSDQGLRPSQRVAARLAGIEATPLAGHEARIRSLLRLDPAADGFTASASIEVEGITTELDVAGVIDVAAERRRMEKDLAAARAEAEQAERKLANASFTAKAPAAVVDKTRQRLAVAQADIARLEQRLASI